MRRMWRDRGRLLEPDESFDDLARRLAAPALSRRQFAGLAIGGVAAVAMGKAARSNQALVTSRADSQSLVTSQTLAAPQAGLPPGSPCPAPIQTGQDCGPIDCPFDGTHLTYVGKGACVINPAFAGAISAIDACAAFAGVAVNVVSAGRTSIPTGGIECSAHLAGHAIDMYLSWTDANGTYHECTAPGLGGKEKPCTGDPSKNCLCKKEIEKQAKKDPNYPPWVFVNCVTSSPGGAGLEWGGNFKRPDPVHIDDYCYGCSNPCQIEGQELMETTGLLCCNGTCMSCPPGTTCATCAACGHGGTSCPSGQTCCAGAAVCVDLQTNLFNCGACGNDCTAKGMSSCVNGTCSCGPNGTQCLNALTCCNNQCLDLNADPNNCGGCGITCAAGAICHVGVCNCGGSECVSGNTCCQGSVNSTCCFSNVNEICMVCNGFAQCVTAAQVAAGAQCCGEGIYFPSLENCCMGSPCPLFEACCSGGCGIGC